MAQENANRIINHWSLLAFAQSFGADFATGTSTNHETGEQYQACTFTKDGKRTFVEFGPSLEGGLSLSQILQQKDSLQIVELEVSPELLAKREQAGRQLETYRLCKKGESSWESVNLLA